MDLTPMTATPTPRFVGLPTPPQPNTPEYKRWAKEASLSFPGGSLTATYGNLVQTFSLAGMSAACTASPLNVSRKGHSRVNTIGGPTTSVAAASYTLKRYPSKRSGNAAAGQPIEIVTDIGSYTARLTGDIQDFVSYLCGNGSNFIGNFSFYSEHGTEFGPFGPIAQN